MTETRFEAVVIGGSAGGVKAVLRLLAELPADFRPPIVLVLHIPADRPSGLAELFGHACPLPTHEALDKQPLEAGTIYVAPPDYHLLVEPDRTLALSCDHPVLYSRPAIDPLFESAADVFGPSVLAILLSGASQDGSEGAAAIRRRGGTLWVQHPDSADARLMPTAAIVRAGADRILDLDAMAAALAEAGR